MLQCPCNSGVNCADAQRLLNGKPFVPHKTEITPALQPSEVGSIMSGAQERGMEHQAQHGSSAGGAQRTGPALAVVLAGSMENPAGMRSHRCAATCLVRESCGWPARYSTRTALQGSLEYGSSSPAHLIQSAARLIQSAARTAAAAASVLKRAFAASAVEPQAAVPLSASLEEQIVSCSHSGSLCKR